MAGFNDALVLVQCNGTERQIADCSIQPQGNRTCPTLGLRCQGNQLIYSYE